MLVGTLRFGARRERGPPAPLERPLDSCDRRSSTLIDVLISAHDITKLHGPRTLLERVSVTIEPHDRLGLIGVNGAGKSTLIRILLGLEEADGGEVQRKRGLEYAIVAQNPVLDPTLTVGEIAQRGLAKNAAVRKRLELVNAEIAELDPAPDPRALEVLMRAQAELTDELERAGGWSVEHRAEAAMHALGVPAKDRLIETLSLGEMRRLGLALGLMEQPELLVLDEPTNHIDVDAIEWLETELAEYPGALILVTHDRYFLDRVANRHAELDRGDLHLYEGNYSEYLAQKAEREALEARVEHKRRRAIENELKWVRRRAPARTTKQKARLERFDALVAVRPKPPPGEVDFRLPHPPRIGKTILELHGLSKSLGGRRLIDDLHLVLKRGDRLGVVGPNGAGKTTLLRMIIGEIEPDTGSIIRGANTSITYADQRRILDETDTVIEAVAGDNDVVFIGDEPQSVHAFLDGLLFDGAQQRTKISALSGGERSRVALARALRVAANVLILDEPTNDLDLLTLRVLEDALIEYPGCSLIVSHDRYFLDRVTTGVLAFEGDGRVVYYAGGYDVYRAGRNREAASAPEAKPAAPRERKPERPKKRSYLEEREFRGMEARILDAEARLGALEKELSEADVVKRLGPKLKEKMVEVEGARREVEALYARWAELDAADKTA
jgi:ABC transport system ATP-binding/permease protein